MKAVFCSESPMYKDAQGNYYNGTFTDEMFSRYFTVADKLTIVMRVRNYMESSMKGKMQRLSNPNIHVVEIPNLMSVKGFFCNPPIVKKILYDEIKTADCVFIRLPSLSGNYAVDIAKRLRRPYLIELVGCPWDAFWKYSIKGKLLAPYSMMMTRMRVKNAPYVLYVTNAFLQERYPTDGKWIACSNVMLQTVDEKVCRKRERHIMDKHPGDVIRIGTAAGIDVPYKGQKYIIRALGRLKREGMDCFEYQLAGGGTGERLMAEAKACDVEGKIKILGQMPHEKVFTWMDRLDIYVQPSETEGLPRAMIEAMSRGLPCCGANVGGIPELIPVDYLFTHGRKAVDEICEILRRIVASRERQIMMAWENFEKAKEYVRDVLENRRMIFYRDFTMNFGSD